MLSRLRSLFQNEEELLIKVQRTRIRNPSMHWLASCLEANDAQYGRSPTEAISRLKAKHPKLKAARIEVR